MTKVSRKTKRKSLRRRQRGGNALQEAVQKYGPDYAETKATGFITEVQSIYNTKYNQSIPPPPNGAGPSGRAALNDYQANLPTITTNAATTATAAKNAAFYDRIKTLLFEGNNTTVDALRELEGSASGNLKIALQGAIQHLEAPVPILIPLPVPMSAPGPKTLKNGGGLGNGYAFTGASITPGLGDDIRQPVSSCMATPRFGETSVNATGLPGQYGGRYSFDLATPLGGMPQVMSIPCEGAYSNPLNPSTAPIQPNLIGGSQALYVPTAGYSQSPSTWTGRDGTPALLSIPYDARAMPSSCLRGGRKTIKRRKSKTKTRRS
jgi:hypothetical protein